MGRLLPLFFAAALAGSPAHGQDTDKSQYSLTNPTPREELRDMSTDRPDKTESPYTVDAGRFQIEMDFVTYTRDDVSEDGADLRFEAVNVVPLNLKAGLTNSTDLQLLFDSYIRQQVTDRETGASQEIDGIGDLTIRLKHNLWGNDGGRTALAVMPFVKLPTNSNGIGNDAVEAGIIVPLALSISERVGIGLMTEVDLLQESDGDGYSPTFINSATISFDLTDSVGLYTELFTEKSIEDGADWVVTWDTGLTYALTDDLQLDGGINVGVTEAADDLNLFIGISRRF
jgi:hypothetical protein